MDISLMVPVVSLLSLGTVGFLARDVNKQDAGTKRMREVASFIREGANAFLKREFKTITYFIAFLAIPCGYSLNGK